MVIQGRNKCVFAGLAAAMWALPASAQALTIGPVVVDDAPLAAGAGLVAGVVVTAVVCGAQNRKLSARIDALEAKIDAYANAEPVATGRHVANGAGASYLLRNPERTAAPAPAPEPVAAAKPEAATKQAEKPVAALKPETAPAAKPMAERIPAVPAADTPAASAAAFSASPKTAKPVEAAAAAKPAARRTRELHVPGEDLNLSAADPDAGEDDYTRVATDYVAKQTFAAKMANRAKGVAQLLTERIGRDAMDGMPVIERADGSVGDVGTSWWETAQAEANREIATSFEHTFAGATPAGEDFTTNAVMMGNPAAVAVAMTTGRWDIVTPETKTSAGSSEMAGVHGVAEKNWRVKTGEFDIVGGPSKVARVVPTVEAEPAPHVPDAWEKSLAAMDERVDDNLISGKTGQFIDFVGDSSSIDEPDGLEPSTNFLSFRAPAGHPEVQDTASYIDFLVNSELGGTVKHNRRHASATGPFEVCR